MKLVKYYEFVNAPQAKKKFDINLIFNTKEFKELTKVKTEHQKNLDKGNLSIVSQTIVDEYAENLKLLQKTVSDYNSNKLNKQGVMQVLTKKIDEVNKTTTFGFKPAEYFKKLALGLLNYIKNSLVPKLV